LSKDCGHEDTTWFSHRAASADCMKGERIDAYCERVLGRTQVECNALRTNSRRLGGKALLVLDKLR
jgi:hypothetical protein